MMRALWPVLTGTLVLMAACGDGDDSPDASTDTGTLDTGGGDAMVPSTTVTFVFTDPEDAPLADVKTAVDTPSGRREGTSDTAGMMTIDIPAASGDTVTLTHALEGYTIVSFVDVVLGDFLSRWDGPVTILLPPLEALLGSRTEVTIMPTGLPPGGRLCASHGADGEAWAICSEPDTSWNFMVPSASIGDAVHVWALDDTGTPVDFVVAPIAAGETSVAVTFDGSFESAPSMRSVRLDFPDDPESPLAMMAELPNEWLGWFSVSDTETGRMWSIAYNPVRDGSDLTVDVMIMTPPMGTDLRYGATAWAQLRSLHSVAFGNFVGDPGDTVEMLGFPHITGGASLAETISFDAPAPVGTDELIHSVSFRNSGGRTVWRLVSPSTSIQAPELPTDYDIDVTFPFPGSMGKAIAQSSTRLDMDALVPGVELDYRSTISAETVFTF